MISPTHHSVIAALDETLEEFVNRLTYCKQDKQLAVVPEQTDIDKTTGQKLFQPITGRGPKFQRNMMGMPIGDYLHSYSFERDELRAEAEEAAIADLRKMSNVPKSDGNSHMIVENVRRQQLFEIFSAIDRDGDGVIDARAAKTCELPEQIANDVLPRVIEAGDHPMDFEMFAELCQDVVSVVLSLESCHSGCDGLS